MEFGRTIREHRRRLGWSLRRLAEAAGCSKAYLSGIENGHFANPPSRRLVEALERALGAGAGELMRLAEWQATPPAVRAEYDRLADQLRALNRREGERRAAWEGRGGRGGVNLDAMFRSGSLQRAVERAAGNMEAVEPTPVERGPAAPASAQSSRTPHPSPLNPHASPLPHVPLINKVAAGYPADFTDLGYPARFADEYVPCPGPPEASDPHAFAARVIGDSMRPDYRPGDVIVFSPQREPTDGSDCFARLLPDHESTFKRVFFEPDGQIRLQPLNPAFPPRIEPPENIDGLYPAIYRVQAI